MKIYKRDIGTLVKKIFSEAESLDPSIQESYFYLISNKYFC